MKEKLQFFPITAFAVIMGLAGLTIAIGKFSQLAWLPTIIYEISAFGILGLFVLFFIAYSAKLYIAPEEVKKDFTHRIRINFFSGISISFILLSIVFTHYKPLLAIPLWWIGTLLQTYFLFTTIRFWIQHNFEIKVFNPAWFIPVVGNILVPIAGADFVHPLVLYFYFSVGFFFWIILFTIFLNRVIFHDQLPEKFIPTFFIILAPPALGFISYIRLWGSWDTFSVFLLFMAYFFIVLLISLYKSFYKLTFFMSWWAFTFPLAAATIASVVAYQISGYSFFAIVAWLMFAAAIIAVTVVAKTTIQHIFKGEVCVEED